MRDFRKLDVWQRAHKLVLQIYTLSLPAEERYGLTSQIRRAAVSIPNNIAEGSKRKSQKDFAHFLNMAEGSLAEVDYLLLLVKDLLVKDLGYVMPDVLAPLSKEADELGKMLYSLRSKVEESL